MKEDFDFNADDDFAKRYWQYKQIDSNAAFNRFKKRVGERKSTRRNNVLRWTIPAAAIVAGIVFFANYITNSSSSESNCIIASIKPGQSMAYLTTAEGSQIALTGQSTSIADITSNPKDTATTQSNSLDNANAMLRVDVPRGGEYSIVLNDGTIVHLNAESSLSFPSVFDKMSRRVHLTGEAYFQVAHSNNCPFIVEANGVEVKQYGTCFNIQAYNDQPVAITLVKGSIGVNVADKGEIKLTPGRQAVVSGSNVSISDVDANAVASWTTGQIMFENKPLCDIAKTLSRWYDVDIEVSPNLCHTRFTGCFSRKGKLSDIFDAIAEITGMKYQYNDKKITCQ